MNKPKIKDAWSYFRDENNWLILWNDERTGLTICKLGHLPCLRLSMDNHTINEWVHYDINPLLYFPHARTLEEIHEHPCYESLSQEEVKELIRNHWEDEE